MVPRAKKVTLWKVIAVLILGMLAYAIYYARDRVLTQRATPILFLPETHIQSGIFYGPGTEYRWLSDHELLLEKFDESPAPKGQKVKFSTYNLTTKNETPLTKLNQLCEIAGVWDCNLSPDGKWLIWKTDRRQNYSTPASSTIHATLLDGSHDRQWKTNAPTIPEWLSDSQHCWVSDRYLGFTNPAQPKDNIEVTLYDMNPPYGSQKRSFPRPGGYERNVYWNVMMLTANRAIGFVDTLSLAYIYRMGPISHHDIWDISFTPNPAPSPHYRVEFPPQVTSVSWRISPDGNRVAWEFEFTYKLPFYAFLRWFFPVRRGGITAGLWVSNLDGSDMHEIGHLTEKDKLFHFLKWMPDGKRLSFMYNDRLWTVPAD